jgi:hypothetical protein
MEDEVSPFEYPAGPDQVLVVYRPPDVGSELDPAAIFDWIARDAAIRADQGQWIVSMAVMPLRHAGAAFSEASGYQTKTAVGVVYGTVGKGATTPDR